MKFTGDYKKQRSYSQVPFMVRVRVGDKKVPVNNSLFAGTLVFLTSTSSKVPVNNELFEGTVPVNNFVLY